MFNSALKWFFTPKFNIFDIIIVISFMIFVYNNSYFDISNIAAWLWVLTLVIFCSAVSAWLQYYYFHREVDSLEQQILELSKEAKELSRNH